GSSTVQSLVLVGCDAGDGVTLAFYVCFPHRLPVQLVEAVRDSCQRLLDRVLLRAITPKVTGELATELGALRRGTPGTFAVVQMPYSRTGSVGGWTCAPFPPVAIVTGTVPAPLDVTGTVIGSSTLGTDLHFGPQFVSTSATITATTTTNTIAVIPQPAAGQATDGGGSSNAISGSSCNPPQPTLNRTVSTAAARGTRLQLDAGGGVASGACGCAGSSGVGSLHGPESTRAIATCAGIGGGGGSLSELLCHTSSTSASRSRSVTTVRPHHLTTAGSQPGGCITGTGGIMGKAAGDRRKTLAGLSALSTVNNMSGVVVLSSRVPILDTSLGGGGGGGADSWMQIVAGNTGPGSVADASQAFLSSSHHVSGSQMPMAVTPPSPADVLRHTASVIVVRDLEAETHGSCQQQLGALVSSVRESITIAATPNPAVGSCLVAANTAPVMSQVLLLGDGADGAGGAAVGGSIVVRQSGPTTPALYLGWEGSGAGSPPFGIGAAGVGVITNAAAAACGLDSEAADVADLRLVCKLGQGGCGSVFLGQMGPGLEVAVKLLELPSCFDIEHFVGQFSIGPGFGPRLRGTGTGTRNNTAGCGISGSGLGGGFGGDTDLGAVLAAEAVRQQVRARRLLLQSATELAMLTSISHPNIVQVYGVYSDVILETRTTSEGQLSYRLRQHVEILLEEQLMETAAAAGTATVDDIRPADYSNVCSAVCMTLCDLGSLETALTERGFPSPPEATARLGSARGSGRGPNAALGAAGTQGKAVDPNSLAFGVNVQKQMRSVCLTLLEVALALRYLHGRNIIHRDLKPGNILLKSRTPTREDPRGFTTKLADFGLALVLDREPIDPPPSTNVTMQPPPPPPPQQQQQQQPGGRLGPDSGSGHRKVVTPPVRYALSDQPCGTVDHMAPEACRGRGSRLTAAVDVYSFGIVMLEVVTGGRRPFGNMPMERIGRLVMAGTRPLFPAWVPTSYRSLAEACWAQDPAARPTAAQLVVAIRQQLHRFTGTAGSSGVGSDSAGPSATPKRVPSTSHVFSTASYNRATTINNDYQPIAANIVANAADAADAQPNAVHVGNV
ncbi:hypothetical protein VaNZ11_008947, partial [Volvox africanus]